MRATPNNNHGFTLLELILTLGLVAILAGATTPFASRFLIQNNFETTVNSLVGSFRKAQFYAIDGKENIPWGVCITEGVIRLYRGTCALPAFQEEYTIPSSVSITGFSDVTFSKRRGEPSGIVSATIAAGDTITVVTINPVGRINTQ